MIKSTRAVSPPTSDWQHPAKTWREVVARYILFIQVPTWRASVNRDGSEKRSCWAAAEASSLERRLLATLDRVLPPSSTPTTDRRAKSADLALLNGRQGRQHPRDVRCSKVHGAHLLRAFKLNEAGYSCLYCSRTAWGVYSEHPGAEPRRTLRFELDHRVTRGRLSDPTRFDPSNLVMACRSCNTIKAEMTERRFRRELASLAAAVRRQPKASQ